MTGPAAIGLAVLCGRLEQALARADMAQITATVADLAHMVRSLGPAARSDTDRAALIATQSLMETALATLQAEMAKPDQNAKLRLAYSAPA